MASKVRSIHEPRVRYGLCRYIRSKGMLVNIGETAENDSSQRQLLAADKNTLPWDGTSWWCVQTGKVIGPDDRPCHDSRCQSGRSCYEAEDEVPIS
jgi:hypothetical protein